MRRWSLVSLMLACLLLSATAAACAGGQTTGGDQSSSSTVTGQPTITTASTTTTLPPAAWQAVTPTGGLPPARLGGSLISLPGDKLLLFGGWGGGADYLDDLWTYDLTANAWAKLSSEGASPAPRASQAAAYDPVGGKLIVFGGFDGKASYHDLWAYDLAGATWTEVKPAGIAPAGRYGHSLVYDPTSKTMVLFGGYDGTTEYGDTWAYDPAANTWKDLRPGGEAPAKRDSQAMAYDSDAKMMVLFGGWSTTKQFDDTWTYSPANNAWAKVETPSGAPVARALSQMVYDPTIKKLVLFGGGNSTSTFGDAWLLDLAERTWTLAGTTGEPPAGRAGHGLTYDSTSSDLLLFGGTDGAGAYFADLWRLHR